MRIAFKEWAVVADALGSGEQIIVLRKGGISEGPTGFRVDHPEFLIFPTLYHQQRESVLPAAQERYDAIAPAFPPPDILRLEWFARVVDWRRLDTHEAALGLTGQHIWRDGVIAERFDWGHEKAIHALALRVHRLPAPVELPMLESYGGCKSWVELAVDVDVSGTQPVLDEAAFQARLAAFCQAVDAGAVFPA
jgi:hypothetical protein